MISNLPKGILPLQQSVSVSHDQQSTQRHSNITTICVSMPWSAIYPRAFENYNNLCQYPMISKLPKGIPPLQQSVSVSHDQQSTQGHSNITTICQYTMISNLPKGILAVLTYDFDPCWVILVVCCISQVSVTAYTSLVVDHAWKIGS